MARVCPGAESVSGRTNEQEGRLGRLTGDRLLDWLASGITAVIVEGADTLAAAEALQAAIKAAGLRCPEDFSLAMTGEQVYPDPHAPVITTPGERATQDARAGAVARTATR
jgi:hypothetical protein